MMMMVPVEEVYVEARHVSTQGEAHSQESQPKDQLGVFSTTKVLTKVAKVHTYTRRRRTISTTSGGISTTEESVSTTGASMPVSIAGMVDKGKAIMQESKPELITIKLQQRQERAGYEAAVRLQEQLDEEERQRIAGVHEEANEAASTDMDVRHRGAATTVSSLDAGQGSESLEADLKQTKKVYGDAYTKLIMKVKKFAKTIKLSQVRRRAKIVVSDDEELEDPFKKRKSMIEKINQDAEVHLVTPT
nr:hypothetical protein [Tanacetum cinerariifolium]